MVQTIHLDYTKVISNLIQKNIESVVKGIYKKGEEKHKDFLIFTGKAFEDYLNTAVVKFNKVKTILYSHKPMPLYDFYVDAHARCGNDRINTNKVSNLLAINNCITFFGTGGTGKSTLFKHLFLNTIETTELIPIFVELKDIDKKQYEGKKDLVIEDLIYDSLKELNFKLDKEIFVKSLKNGRYVLFLDAFDEVKDHNKTFISDEVIRLSTQYSSNHYLVSSRPNNMLERGWDNFYDFRIEPLTRQKSVQLIQNLNYDEELKSRFLLQLQEGNLFETHHSFCSNPLLLTLMLLTYEEFAEIPDKVHIFYSRAFNVLYSKHDATKGSFIREKRFEKKGLASDDFETVLGAFSAISYSDSSISFTRDALIDYIKQARDFTEINFDVRDFEIDIVEAVCILALEGSEYKYQHRSFQEYFTAKFVNDLTDIEQQEFLTTLIETNPNSIRDEVFNLLFEINRVKLEKNFLMPLLINLRERLKNDINNEANQIDFLSEIFHRVSLRADTRRRDNRDESDNLRSTYIELIPTSRVVHHSESRVNYKYMHIARFVGDKYMKIMDDLPKEFYGKQTHRKDIQKDFWEICNRRSELIINNEALKERRHLLNLTFEGIDEDEQLFQDMLILCKHHILDLKIAMFVLEKLEDKYTNTRSIKDLFKKKREKYI